MFHHFAMFKTLNSDQARSRERHRRLRGFDPSFVTTIKRVQPTTRDLSASAHLQRRSHPEKFLILFG
jgi:hypothetical protein